MPNGRLPTGCKGNVPNEGKRPEFGMVSGNFDYRANLLLVNSFFAMISSDLGNIEEVPSYLLQCTRQLETLQECRSHPWDNTMY